MGPDAGGKMTMRDDTFYLSSWSTPLTNIKETGSELARIKKVKYNRGFYNMEGINGFFRYYLKKSTWITNLQINDHGEWKVWMVDDPLHYLGIKQYLEELGGGSLLCAGLGLGLMLHHATKMSRFTKIDVVEINQDVIDLIKPILPDDERINIINVDFYDFIKQNQHYDNLLWDLAVGNKDETKRAFMIGKAYCNIFLPEAKKLYFGEKYWG